VWSLDVSSQGYGGYRQLSIQKGCCKDDAALNHSQPDQHISVSAYISGITQGTFTGREGFPDSESK